MLYFTKTFRAEFVGLVWVGLVLLHGKIHNLSTFFLLPEPNTETGASKLKEVKVLKEFPWSRFWLPVVLHCVVTAGEEFYYKKR